MIDSDTYREEKYFTKALKNGKLVDISEVENGLECNCICPSCETPVVAYNNPKNKNAHHFKHHSKKDCHYYYETMLHYMAKEIIAEELKLIVPKHEFILSDYARDYNNNDEHIYNPNEIIKPYLLKFESVEVEKYQNGIKPDLICKIKDKELHIEIAVTHFVDEEKANKIELNGVTSLEIDLSGFNRDMHETKLREVLSGSIKLMKWFNNVSVEKDRKKALLFKYEIQAFISTHSIEKTAYYGKQRKIFQCPIVSKEIEVSVKNCNSCKYQTYLREYPEFTDWENRISRNNTLIGCIGHQSYAFDNLLKDKGVQVGRNKAFDKQ